MVGTLVGVHHDSLLAIRSGIKNAMGISRFVGGVSSSVMRINGDL